MRAGWIMPVWVIWLTEVSLVISLITVQARSLFLELFDRAYPDPPVPQPFTPSGPMGNGATSKSKFFAKRKLGVCQIPEQSMATWPLMNICIWPELVLKVWSWERLGETWYLSI